jgi:hypothetical protein
MKSMKTKIALLFLFTLTGCGTFNLGYVKPQVGKSPDQQALDILTCKDSARLATDAASNQVANFLLGMTIVAAPLAFESDKAKQRSVYKECMSAKGYEVIPADDDTTADNSSAPKAPATQVRITLSDGWTEERITPKMQYENVIYFALNRSKDIGVGIAVLKRSEVSNWEKTFEFRRQAQIKALDNAVETEPSYFNLGTARGLQTEVTGNLKTGFKQRLTYLQSAIQGKDEVVFINFWVLADGYAQNKAEFLKIRETLTGFALPSTGVNLPPSTPSTTRATQTTNIAIPSGSTDGAKRLIELKSLLDAGVINAQDYEIKKQIILKSM